MFYPTTIVKMKFFAALALAAAVQAAPVSDCKEQASLAEVQCMRDCNWGWRCTTNCALDKVDDFVRCELNEQLSNATTSGVVRARDEACTQRVAEEESACINNCNGATVCTIRCSTSRIGEYARCG